MTGSISIRQSVMLPTSGPSAAAVGPIVLGHQRGLSRSAQPAGEARIDRSTPAGAAISTLIPFNGCLRDLVTGTALVQGTGTPIVAGPRGLSLRGTQTGTYAYLPLNLSQHRILSLSFWMYWDVYTLTDEFAMEFTANINTNNGNFALDPNNSTGPGAGAFALAVGDNGGGLSASYFTRPSALTWHHYAFVIDRNYAAGSRPIFRLGWVDGVPLTLNLWLSSYGTATNFANDNLYFLSRAGNTLRAAGNLQNVVLRAGYYLTSADVQAEYQNPLSLFAPIPQPIWGDR